MNFREFEHEFERLKRIYGNVKYPQERINIIFESIGGITKEALENQISRFIAESEKAPMLNDFLNAFHSKVSDLKKEQMEIRLKNTPPCMACNNTGHVTMYSVLNGFEYAFQCTCKRGELMQPSLPGQYPNMGEQFVSHRAWVLGRFDRLKIFKEKHSGEFLNGN